MAGAFDETKFAVRKSRGDFLREPNSEGAILGPVPEPDRHAHFFQRKTPGIHIDLRVCHHASGGRAPGLPGAFETRFECAGIAQNIRVDGLENFEEQRPDAHGSTIPGPTDTVRQTPQGCWSADCAQVSRTRNMPTWGYFPTACQNPYRGAGRIYGIVGRCSNGVERTTVVRVWTSAFSRIRRSRSSRSAVVRARTFST